MNNLMVKLINLYKIKTQNNNPTCRYHPTCSTYSLESYKKHNFFYASLLSFWRILRCNPFSKGGFDPVPKTRKERKHDHEHEHDLS